MRDADGNEVNIYLTRIARRHALLLILADCWHLLPHTAFSFLRFRLSSIIALVALDRSLCYYLQLKGGGNLWGIN